MAFGVGHWRFVFCGRCSLHFLVGWLWHTDGAAVVIGGCPHPFPLCHGVVDRCLLDLYLVVTAVTFFVICLALLGSPKILLCDEIFAALDVLTIQMLKEILVNLQQENPQISIVICEHQARELLSIVDRAIILSNCNIIAQGTPSELMNDKSAKSQYFGEFFKFN